MGKVHRRRLVAVVVLSAVIGPALPAFSHADYHWVHHVGSQRRRGIHWSAEVTNPAVPPWSGSGTVDHFVAPAWMFEPPGGTGPLCGTSGDHWIEAGWGERADLLLPGGQPYRFIYGFDTVNCQWVFPGIVVDPGETLEFKIVPGTDVGCSTGSGLCTWSGSVKRNGIWSPVHSAVLPVGNDLFPDIGSEVQVKNSGTHFTLSNGDGDIDVYDTDLRLVNGTWVAWTESELPATVHDDTWYDIRYVTRFRTFYTYL